MKNNGGRVIILGTNFLAGIGLLSFVGHYIDNKTGHDYLYTLTGAIVGFIWAMYETWKFLFIKSSDEAKKGDEN